MLQCRKNRDLFGSPQSQAEVKDPAPQNDRRRKSRRAFSGMKQRFSMQMEGVMEQCICCTQAVPVLLRTRTLRVPV